MYRAVRRFRQGGHRRSPGPEGVPVAGRDPDAEPWSYYEHWLTALETVLAGSGLLSESMLDERTKEVLATPRDAGHQYAHREPVAVDPPVR